MKSPQLWEAIEAFSFNEVTFGMTFTRRLACDNDWSSDYSARTIDAYRRFIYLAAVFPGEVAPSPAIERVWLLHLTYTESYWDRLCGDVLQAPLHHDSVNGQSQVYERYVGLYQQTRDHYQKTFGELPPEDLWPDPRSLDQPMHNWRWVDLEQSVVFRRSMVWLSAVVMSVLGAGLWMIRGDGAFRYLWWLALGYVVCAVVFAVKPQRAPGVGIQQQ